jgi:hypothetical protein
MTHKPREDTGVRTKVIGSKVENIGVTFKFQLLKKYWLES